MVPLTYLDLGGAWKAGQARTPSYAEAVESDRVGRDLAKDAAEAENGADREPDREALVESNGENDIIRKQRGAPHDHRCGTYLGTYRN